MGRRVSDLLRVSLKLNDAGFASVPYVESFGHLVQYTINAINFVD